MKSDEVTSDDRLPQPAMPFVTVVIVNYNYGRFLAAAVASVKAQTYPWIECIIVDNASTDESAEVLETLALENTLTIIRRSENGGQSRASVDGFEAASGDYIIFLDADDYLLPQAVETHIYVHLSLRIPVGFTSGDIVQTVDNRMVVATTPAFSDFVRSGKGRVPELARPIERSEPALWRGLAPVSIEALHLQRPPRISPWVWSPTSANCFRTDALRLFLEGDVLRTMPSGTDVFLLHGIGALMGSVLIDRPLAVYRLHGANVFSKHPALNGIRHFDDGNVKSNTDPANQVLIDLLIGQAAFYVSRMHRKIDFIRALNAINALWPRLKSQRRGCPTYLSQKIVENYEPLSAVIGGWELVVWMITLRISPLIIVRLAISGKA